jgi:NADH:ubiquinone oxidoreductase subunit 6 (subunit J)
LASPAAPAGPPPPSTAVLGEALLGRFVVPFEVVSFLLLAALIGGITLARKDLSPAEEEATEAV